MKYSAICGLGMALLFMTARADGIYVTTKPQQGDQPLWINSPVFYNGNELYELCGKNIPFCNGYISGVADVLASQSGNSMCLPKGVVIKQVADVVMKYLTDHPESRHYNANSEIFLALSIAFPCKGAT